tara:strand:- start:589 stop:1377 length:789 start_codon:yes stop_codon:yes gene_type:complete
MSNELTLITGNAIGSLLSTPLVGLSTAMNQYINSNKININFTNYSNSALFYMRYIPAAIISASALSFYVSSPILQSLGMDNKLSDSVALGSIGPILSPLYARQEAGITLVSLKNMSQCKALNILKGNSNNNFWIAPGTKYTFYRNSVSLGIGGALAADGGEFVSKYVIPKNLNFNYPVSSLVVTNGLIGCMAGYISGIFEYCRISSVLAHYNKEKFSFNKHVYKLIKEKPITPFLILRSSHIGFFYMSFAIGQILSRDYIFS